MYGEWTYPLYVTLGITEWPLKIVIQGINSAEGKLCEEISEVLSGIGFGSSMTYVLDDDLWN